MPDPTRPDAARPHAGPPVSGPPVSGLLDAEAAARLVSLLIRAESPDPPGDERRVCAALARELTALGFDPAVEEFAPGRFNLLVRLRGSGERAGLVLSSHMDTLPAGEAPWARPPFGGEVEGEPAAGGAVIHGRGAADMKSGLAALISALLSLRGAPLKGDLVLAVTGGESSNLLGARRLVETRALAGCGAILVAEPTSLDVVTATTAALWLRLAATGRAGHGSARGTGGASDAIATLLAALPLLEGMLPGESHPLLGGCSVQVGRIRGGSAVNLTADRAEAEIDLRLPPSVDAEALEATIRARLARGGVTVARMDLKPAQDCDPAGPLCAAALAAAAVERGRPLAPRGARYFSDACVLAPAFGLETATLGPGTLGASGATDESVRLDDVLAAARIHAAAARALLLG